ncbi:MAG: sigma-70 family RNA polymerase sigma factor [Pirellulales bacterium]
MHVQTMVNFFMEVRQGELERMLCQGDRTALAEYLDLRRGALLAYVERQLGTALRRKIEPEDVLQEVAVEAVRVFAQGDRPTGDPFSWLCEVAQRRIIDAHRRFFDAQKRDAGREVALGFPATDTHAAGLADLLVATITSPSQAFSRGQREFSVQQALIALPEDARAAIRMRYVDGLPTKEIALRLGKTDGAVRVLLTRTLKKLEEALSGIVNP